MRTELVTPFEPLRLQKLLPLTEAVYQMHENKCEFAEELKQISRLVGRVVGRIDVIGAFGAIGPDEFAKRLAIDWDSIPMDLSETELLEVLDAVCEVRGSAVIVEYWVRCLALNTGDKNISDLIFWPENYLGGAYEERDLTPVEMLEVALDTGRAGKSRS